MRGEKRNELIFQVKHEQRGILRDKHYRRKHAQDNLEWEECRGRK